MVLFAISLTVHDMWGYDNWLLPVKHKDLSYDSLNSWKFAGTINNLPKSLSSILRLYGADDLLNFISLSEAIKAIILWADFVFYRSEKDKMVFHP